VWEDVWHEATPGTESGIRQHTAEICELLKVALESPSWTMKAQVNRYLTDKRMLKKCFQMLILYEMPICVFYSKTDTGMSLRYITEHRGRVAITRSLYSGDPGCKSWPDIVTEFFMGFSQPL
jgi:hypothetical protein